MVTHMRTSTTSPIIPGINTSSRGVCVPPDLEGSSIKSGMAMSGITGLATGVDTETNVLDGVVLDAELTYAFGRVGVVDAVLMEVVVDVLFIDTELWGAVIGVVLIDAEMPGASVRVVLMDAVI